MKKFLTLKSVLHMKNNVSLVDINNTLKQNDGFLSFEDYVSIFNHPSYKEVKHIMFTNYMIESIEIDIKDNAFPPNGVLSLEYSKVVDYINSDDYHLSDIDESGNSNQIIHLYKNNITKIRENKSFMDGLNKITLSIIHDVNPFIFNFKYEDMIEILLFTLLFNNLGYYLSQSFNDKYNAQCIVNSYVIKNIYLFSKNQNEEMAKEVFNILMSMELDRVGIVSTIELKKTNKTNPFKFYQKIKNKFIESKINLDLTKGILIQHKKETQS